jgi:hypothetical protein
MIAAYVLAGELGKANSSPEEALLRYERRLAPFMLAKQRAAEKFAGSFVPKSLWGLFARDQVTKLLAIPLLTKRLMGTTLLDRIDLPHYSESVASPHVRSAKGHNSKEMAKSPIHTAGFPQLKHELRVVPAGLQEFVANAIEPEPPLSTNQTEGEPFSPVPPAKSSLKLLSEGKSYGAA